MISPAEFIPVAEDIGLIVSLGEMGCCARPAPRPRKWPSDVKVAVNLSPVQFRSRKSGYRAVIFGAGAFRPGRRGGSSLKLPSRCFLAETETNLAILHQLRELGVSHLDG